MDVEAEMGRFEMALDNELQSYSMMAAPMSAPEHKVEVALDCLATCCLGVCPFFRVRDCRCP